jgi:2-methylcitrate dehydratase PrpD
MNDGPIDAQSRRTGPSGHTARLAAGLAALEAASFDDGLLAYTRIVFADTVACMIGGLSHPEVARLTAALRGPGVSERFTGVSAPRGDLALLLGFAGAALELDEGHYAAGGHPAVHAAAAVLAEAARNGAGDEACVRAFLAGYEAGGRVGEATRLRPAAHPHGTWGVVGAAVGVATLRGFDAVQMTAAIDVAASLGLATSGSAPLAGGSVRSAWVGAAARNGMLACDLVEAGVTGEPEGCAVVFGQVLGSRFDAGRLTDGLGERFLITENFMKRDASCRETHGGLAALAEARGERPLRAAEVLRIEIETFADAARLSDVAPVNEMAARFSIPAAVAATVIDGAVAADAFTPERLERPALRELMRRVAVAAAPDATAALPGRRVCRCRIVLTDGAVMAGTVDTAPGDAGSRLPIQALRTKFDALCARAPGGTSASADALRRFLV